MAKKKTKKVVKKTKPKSKTVKIPKVDKKLPKKTAWIIFGLFLVVIIALLFFYYSKGMIGKAYVTECESATCFIEKANECKPAKYTTIIGTSTIEIESLQGCILKKTVLNLDATEPQEIRDFFTGKYMTCTYEKGEFNDDFAYQISGPLEECEGPLVDAINAVI